MRDIDKRLELLQKEDGAEVAGISTEDLNYQMKKVSKPPTDPKTVVPKDEQAGLSDDDETLRPDPDPHQHIRNLIKDGSDLESETFDKDLTTAVEEFHWAVLINSSIVLTTFSNSADKMLQRYFKPN